jgi:hypothetical protein
MHGSPELVEWQGRNGVFCEGSLNGFGSRLLVQKKELKYLKGEWEDVGMKVFLVLYLAVGALIAAALIMVRKARTQRGVSPANGEPDSLGAFFVEQLSGAGWEVEEYELLDGKRISARPGTGQAGNPWVRGLTLAVLGVLPAIVWIALGPSRITVTLKTDSGFLLVIVETAGRPAQRLWRKINLRLTRRTLAES